MMRRRIDQPSPNTNNTESQNQSETQVVITEEAWEQRMQLIEPSRSEMNKMVMNFLILEGFKDAALSFSQEA
jgi:hypothetical protein